MKNKIVLGCFIAASMLAMPSCSDFLTENPKGKLTPENFFSNPPLRFVFFCQINP